MDTGSSDAFSHFVVPLPRCFAVNLPVLTCVYVFIFTTKCHKASSQTRLWCTWWRWRWWWCGVLKQLLVTDFFFWGWGGSGVAEHSSSDRVDFVLSNPNPVSVSSS